MNKKSKLIIITSALVILLLISTIILTITGRKTPLSGTINSIQYSQCKKFADKLLKTKNATYPFNRCEKETYKVAGTDKSVIRVYAVAGEVEKKWEFECGYNTECATYVGWFDENNDLFDFVEPPHVANHDPSVYTLGCGQVNTSSTSDVKVEPELVFERGMYRWRINYNNTSTNSLNNSCKVSGTSLIGYKEVLSNVKAKYQFATDNCSTDTPTACQTAKALMMKSTEPCKYNQQELSGIQSKYDLECVSNYIAQTGNNTLCGTEANYGKITCDNIVIIKRL